MLIGKDWKIESDSLNVTILERKHVAEKDGVAEHDNWYSRGYFADPKAALRWLVNHKVTGSGMKDMETIVDELDNLYGLIGDLKNLPGIARETVSATESAE